MGEQLKPNVSCPVVVDLIEHLILRQVALILPLALVRLELLVLLLALHLVEVVHDAHGDSLGVGAVGGDETVVESELEALPVEVFVLLLVVDRLRVGVGQVADVQVLEAVEEVPQGGGDGFEVGQGGLQQGGLLLNDWVEDSCQVEDLQGHVVVDLAFRLDLFLRSLLHFELHEEVLDFGEGFGDLDGHVLVVAVVGGQFELLGLVLPSVVGLEGAFEELLVEGFLTLEVDDVTGVDGQRPIESVELDPYLLLEHRWCLLGGGEEDLFDIDLFPGSSDHHAIALHLGPGVVDLQPAVPQDDLEHLAV